MGEEKSFRMIDISLEPANRQHQSALSPRSWTKHFTLHLAWHPGKRNSKRPPEKAQNATCKMNGDAMQKSGREDTVHMLHNFSVARRRGRMQSVFLALKIAAAPCHCGVWRDLALALLARPWPCRPDFDDSSDEAVDGIVRGSLTLIWRVEACSWGGRGQVCQVSRVSWFQRLTTTTTFPRHRACPQPEFMGGALSWGMDPYHDTRR